MRRVDINARGRGASGVIRKITGAKTGWAARALGVLILLVSGAYSASASVALLLEEPFGRFGAVNPTGHAAVYLSHVCAESPTSLRMCRPGEFGTVISRYHKIDGYDWIAMPLIPYLYAVDNPAQVPSWVDKDQVLRLRDAYRRSQLQSIAPDGRDGRSPKGEWIQLVGSSYDRKIYGFQIATTAEQDERFIALFNDRKDVSHFNLFFRNCADFSRDVLNTYIPGVVHRNFIADVGLTTPKQVARSLARYGEAHPDAEFSEFVIPQVDGRVKRSHSVNGVVESLVKSKKYLIPMAILTPHVTGTVALAYMVDGRFRMPKDAPVFQLDDAAVKPEEMAPMKTQPESAEPASSASAAQTGGGSMEGPAAPGRTAALLR